MRITTCKYEYLESTIKRCNPMMLQSSQRLINEVLSASELKELVTVADSYDLYSSFCIYGDRIFFVYGKNKKMVTLSDFVYFGGSVFPVEYFNKNEILSHEGFVLTGWNAVLISGDPSVLDTAKESMYLLGLFCDVYLQAGFDYLPEAFVWNDDAPSRELLKKLEEIKSLDVSRPRKKKKLLDRIYPFIKDVAVWEWPISPANFRKCGFTAFLQSNYCPFVGGRNAYKYAKHVYSDISLWEQQFCIN